MARLYDLDDPDRYDIWRARIAEDLMEIERSRAVALASANGPLSFPDRWQPTRVADSRTQSFAHLSDQFSLYASELASGRVDRTLSAIRSADAMNAFVHLFDDTSTTLHAGVQPASKGLLAGRTVAVKDMFDIEGYSYNAGTRLLPPRTAFKDAVAVERLRARGAIILGTTNMHALAFGAISHSTDFGAVDNPRRSGYISGGSSGGSAAAVAAGMVDVALGTDTGGSIRIPSSLCGVVGFKPTFGAVPVDGVLELGRSLDHVGPIARTVADTKLAFDALTGRDPQPVAPTSLVGLTVGVLGGMFCEHLQPEVYATLLHAADTLSAAGAHVIRLDIPTLDMSPGVMTSTLPPEAITTHLGFLEEHARELFDDVRLRFESAMFRTVRDYVLAQRFRSLMRSALDSGFEHVDFMLTPTTPIVAQPHNIDGRIDVGGAQWAVQQALTRLTTPFNLTGNPALSLPWRLDAGGCGIGIQLIGNHNYDLELLNFAAELETLRATAR